MNDFDETEEEYDDGRPHPLHKLGKILTPIFTLACLLVTVLILFRICSQNKIPSEIDTISVNDSLKSAYAEKGDDLSVIYQDLHIYSTERNVRLDENGKIIPNAGKAYFAVPSSIFIPDARQLQLVLRYNNSTLKYLAEDYKAICPKVPDRSEEVYDITLIKVTDLTPDDQTDNDLPAKLAEERFTVTSVKSAEKKLHNFRRLTFENFDLDGALRVYLCIYYKGDVDYGEDPYATVTLYDSTKPTLSYTLTERDVAALEGTK